MQLPALHDLLLVILATSGGSCVANAISISSASVHGRTFVNKGLVGFGLIPSNFTDSTGDTLGGIGSGLAIQSGSWRKVSHGRYEGTFIAAPDRGYNVDTPINYQSRHHLISFTFSPYYGQRKLSFKDAQKTLQLKYFSTTLRYERGGKKTTGLDGFYRRPADSKTGDPPLPLFSVEDDRLAVDAESIVINDDGTFWVSDEYGPYIYRFSGSGQLINVIQPPSAFLPLDASGNLNFTSWYDPATGRAANQGFEGLTLDRSTSTLYAILQSATIQDGGSSENPSRFTRMLGYDVSNPMSPVLREEYVVPLPLNEKGNAFPVNELHFIGKGTFLAMTRDSNGRGEDDIQSAYKRADLVSVLSATNIAGTPFDHPNTPIARNGTLNSTISAASYVSFVNFLDDKQLGRFGLHNGSPDDETLINAKWESLALAPVHDDEHPNDYFLFTASDNDFMSTHGVTSGVTYDAGMDVDNQFMVYRVTLPDME